MPTAIGGVSESNDASLALKPSGRNNMTHSITKLTSLFTLLVLTAATTQANADEYRHIDRLAVKIQNTSRQLLRETIHYRHTAEYRHMVADANELYRAAKHIHDVTHFEGNLTHLQIDLNKLDRSFHHVEEVFDRVEHDAAYGNGHVHGNTAHVKRLLKTIEDNIHHIQEDVASLRRRPIVTTPIYRPVYNPAPRSPYGGYGGYGHGRNSGHGYGNGRSSGHGYGGYGSNSRYGGSGFGFSIGGGSSRISFNF